MHLKKRLKLFNRKRKPLILLIGRNCSGITLNNIKRMWVNLWAKENVFEELSTMATLIAEVPMVMVHGKKICLITIQTFPCPLTMKKEVMMTITLEMKMV